ncbi:MAG TPA: tripartite tricarboxylate transporter substrate binding protein [Usitatibacter sp.]|nr:tripartite tricarboxylate transporter substrate binding protein [Usitatibacter sp.]
MRMRRWLWAVAAAAAVAHAEFPEKPVHFVVPFAPGGGADSLARAVGEGMSRYLGQPVVVDNKPGGDATIASAFVKAAAPDGYTILFGSNTGFSGAPALHRNIGYDPVRDFTPISMMGMFPYFLTVNKDVPARNLRELVDYARAHPGELNYASGNAMGIVGTGQLIAAEKLQMTHVPYKGEAPAMLDLLSNRVQMIFTTNFIIPYAKDGRVRVLAAAMDERHDSLPEVPTMAEAGFGYLAIRGWAAVFAPAGLPRDIQAKLNAAVVESLKMQSTRDALALQGFPGKGSTPQELGEFTRAQLQSWAAGAKAAGIQPE